MLVLSRRVGQSVICGRGVHQVRVILAGVKDDVSVRLGFEADQSVNIYREELGDQKVNTEDIDCG